MKTAWITTALFLSGACAAASGDITFHVSPNGKDTNPGTAASPFSSLDRAQDAVRKAGSGSRRTVVVHGGSYQLKRTLEFTKMDSGTAQHPVVWRSAPNEQVRLVGGPTIPAAALRPTGDAAQLARLDPAAAGHVVCADLSSLGIPLSKQFPIKYHGAPPGPELFCNDTRLELAHWPNKGWATIDRVLDPGSIPREGDNSNRPGSFIYSGQRAARWRSEDGIWLQGYWRYDWYDEVIRVGSINTAQHSITLAAPHVYSLQKGNPSPRRYKALNVLEELDQPGEFYIDRNRNQLYLWPPEDARRLVISTLETPLVSIVNAEHIELRGLILECGLGNGIEIGNSSFCAMEACEVRNIRLTGISVIGGTKDRIADCDVHDTGTGGVIIEGGDRKTLTPAGHQALNNHIYRFSIHQQTSAYGLSFGGVGNIAAHNLIHDAPHQAIFVGGNDHLFEYNEVHHVCTETDDCGALYKGRNPSCRGNMIRFNYWHDIGSPMGHGNAAIYFDDGDGGDTVFGNVFYHCGDPGRGPFGTVFSHGGHGIVAQNNVFIECKRALGSAQWDDARWRDALNGGQDCFFPDKLLKEVDITKPPYTTHYPELQDFMNPPPGALRISGALYNLLVKCDQTAGGNWRFDKAQNLVTDMDPGFVNAAKGNYELARGAMVYRELKGFEPIPFSKIGLKRDRSAGGKP